jgi:regulator of protease activity HflC (stomatin/prohibitin superfamily)
MFGFRYLRTPPTTWVIQHRGGQLRREGAGLSFWYFAPSSTLVLVPLASTDVPFMFAEATADFQDVTVQGHLAVRVIDPKKLSALLDHSVGPNGKYLTDDAGKVPLRMAQAAQTATRAQIQSRPLRAALGQADAIAAAVHQALSADAALQALGVEILSTSILAIRPVPETGRALEAEARERLLKEADDAIYLRRNNSVEQERRIRKNEIETESAVANLRREMEQTQLAGQIALEERRRQLVALEAENSRARADSESYASEARLRPLRDLDPRLLQVLSLGSAEPGQVMALAFQDLAANASKVGNLNISPELLDSLLRRSPDRPAKGAR